MSGPIVYVDHSEIVEGRVDELLTRIDEVVEQLRAKARLLGDATVLVHPSRAGFVRVAEG
jgi:hypothetical protein